MNLVIGVPNEDSLKGAAYVCKDCFNYYRQEHIKVEGEMMGEGFGAATAACDINNDNFDDLLVGAPTYSGSRNSRNVGRVHVFTNKAEAGSRSLISIK